MWVRRQAAGLLGLQLPTPAASFPHGCPLGVQTDPEAAKIVFESGVPLTMVPLEVTHTALVTTSVLQRVRTHQPSPFLRLMTDLLMFFSDTYLTGE